MAYPAAHRSHAVALYGQLGSTARVASRMGIAHSTVQTWLHQAGVVLGQHGGRRSGAGRKAGY